MDGAINAYFDDILSKFQCGFRKDYSAQHRLFYMIKEIRKIRDSKRVFAALLMDLSKTFDSISHKLLLAKLHAYGFDKILLTFMHASLSQRQQKTKVGSTFSELMSIKYFIWCSPRIYLRVTFIYILYLRFVILNNHLELGSYADNTIPFVFGENFDEILGELEKCMAKISEWFLHNCLKGNPRKLHFF